MNPTGFSRACLRMCKLQNESKHVMSERSVLLGNVANPFLVGLHFSFQTKKKLYFVLDYVNGGACVCVCVCVRVALSFARVPACAERVRS